ncbi:YetF domain-containing protein [Arthrobacter sp. GCM10027362]|uniref:YetF domain-containing protein n=1 Tax=Arthrobacter sp. GCM10027362 TaxID=3273379 RepID=UPI003631F2C0
MWKALGVSPFEAVAVVVSAVGIALVFLLLLRLLGQRSVARMSTFDVAVLLVLGSAGGRVITGYTPTLAAGAIALAALAVLRWAADKLARTRIGALLVRDRPILLVDGERILAGNLKRARVSEAELWETLRSGGIRNLTEVALVVLEGTGAISIIKRGAPLDPRLLSGIDGTGGQDGGI